MVQQISALVDQRSVFNIVNSTYHTHTYELNCDTRLSHASYKWINTRYIMLLNSVLDQNNANYHAVFWTVITERAINYY
jgi:hypothetical protein